MSKNPSLSRLSLRTLYDLLQPITLPGTSPRAKFTNWGLTFTCSPLAVFEPETQYHCELILELARREGRTVRAVGVGHSPSDLACTTGYMLRTEKLDKLVAVSSLLFVPIWLLRDGFVLPQRYRMTDSRHLRHMF